MKYQKGDVVYFCDIETRDENPYLEADSYPILWRGTVTDSDENGYVSVKLDKNKLSQAVSIEGTIEDLLYRTPEEAVCEFLANVRQQLEEQIRDIRGQHNGQNK